MKQEYWFTCEGNLNRIAGSNINYAHRIGQLVRETSDMQSLSDIAAYCSDRLLISLHVTFMYVKVSQKGMSNVS
jgi:hypothetical protein